MEKIRPNDNIILVMGPTGAGKSQFIESALQDPTIQIAKESLQSHTQAITPYRLSCRPNIQKAMHDDTVVLVDTPGFDDTSRDDERTLTLIAKWLKQQLCGLEAADSVVFVTTMWDLPTQGQSAEQNLQQLQKEFWKDMINNGAKVARFNKEDDVNSTWSVISPLAFQKKTRKVLRLQEELVKTSDLKRTSAFRALMDDLARLTQDYHTKNEEYQSLSFSHKSNPRHPELLKMQSEVAFLQEAINEAKRKKIFKRTFFGLFKSAEEKRFEQISQSI